MAGKHYVFHDSYSKHEAYTKEEVNLMKDEVDSKLDGLKLYTKEYVCTSYSQTISGSVFTRVDSSDIEPLSSDQVVKIKIGNYFIYPMSYNPSITGKPIWCIGFKDSAAYNTDYLFWLRLSFETNNTISVNNNNAIKFKWSTTNLDTLTKGNTEGNIYTTDTKLIVYYCKDVQS